MKIQMLNHRDNMMPNGNPIPATGCDIFGRILGSIPSEEGWFNTLEGFLAAYGPPYEPALWLLPFSLVVVYFIVESK